MKNILLEHILLPLHNFLRIVFLHGAPPGVGRWMILRTRVRTPPLPHVTEHSLQTPQSDKMQSFLGAET